MYIQVFGEGQQSSRCSLQQTYWGKCIQYRVRTLNFPVLLFSRLLKFLKTVSLKTILQFTLAFLCFCTFYSTAKAAHIVGGEITYECLGWVNDDPGTNTRRYQFYMKIYRDCQGGGAGFDSGPSGSFFAEITIYRQGLDTVFQEATLSAPEVTSIEPTTDPCVQAPPNICVEEGLYTFPIVELPVSDSSYIIAYQRCCRNNTITNIIAPGDAGATYAMELTPKAQASCNNSPVFNEFPPPVICVNQPLAFDHSATDAEGDQLVYELCSPLLGGGNDQIDVTSPEGLAPQPESRPPYDPVNFAAPDYSPIQPLGASSDLSIDLNTGLITGSPGEVGQFVVGVCVSEYRDGELLSVVRRDFQFNVAVCDPIVVADIAGGEVENDTFYLRQCDERRVELTNLSREASFIQEYQWRWGLGNQDTVLKERDLAYDFPDFGRYQGQLLLNPGSGCSDSLYLTIDLIDGPETAFAYAYDTCQAGPVLFTDQSTVPNPSANRTWRFGDGRGAPDKNPSHRYLKPGTYDVSLSIVDEFGCGDSTTQSIDYFPVPPLLLLSPSSSEACTEQSIVFNNLSELIDERYETEWEFGDGNSSLAFSPTYVYQEPGVFDVSLRVTSPIGCQTDTVFKEVVTITSGPRAAFSYSPQRPDILNPEVSFTNLSENAGIWQWSFGDGQISREAAPVYEYRDTGLQEVRLIATHPLGCSDTAVQVIDIFPSATYFLPNAFSPNNDNLNDTFRGKGYLEGITDFQMRIWNRWGALIFETQDIQEGWNGRMRNTGRPVPSGTYMCQVIYRTPRGKRREINTTATLIR